MAITFEKNIVRDLCIMVRKGSFQFEPTDRVPVKVADSAFYIGGISRDELTGSLSYSLYNANGQFIPSSKGLRELNTLSNVELNRLHEVVASYYERSINRCANILDIIDVLKKTKDNILTFTDGFKPSILSMNGSNQMKEFIVHQVWLNEYDLYCSCSNNDVNVNLPLLRIDDRGISNIKSCINSQKTVLEKAPSIEVTRRGMSI